MSRSYKKVCGGGNCGASSEKEYKTQSHQEFRTNIKTIIRSQDVTSEDFDIPISEKEFGDPWCGPKDGQRIYNKKGTLSEESIRKLRMK